MKIRAGYDITLQLKQPMSIIFMLRLHPVRRRDLITDDGMQVSSCISRDEYYDAFGNICTRVHAPAGQLNVRSNFLIRDSGMPDPIVPHAVQSDVDKLPSNALQFLIPSRYCDIESLSAFAWSQFGQTKPGWERVQAICDYVHGHLTFGYSHARATRTASNAHQERVGVCRDFAHLAIALCRCMTIPARYCTGYLGDIGVPADPAPMDFSAWFEVLLGDRWYTFDARHNRPRTGRLLIARGRDAADVAISTGFGESTLEKFVVVTHEESETSMASRAQGALSSSAPPLQMNIDSPGEIEYLRGTG